MRSWKVVVAVLLGLWIFGDLNVDFETLLTAGIPLIFVGVGLFGLFGAVRTYRRSQYVEDFPTATVRSAASGLTEIKGRVVPAGETITAPFTGRECVLCQYVVRKPTTNSSDDNPGLLPIDYGLVGVPFYVEDQTGRMLVRPEGADVRIPKDIFSLDAELQASGRDKIEETGRLFAGRGSADEPPLESFDRRRESWYNQFGLSDRMYGLVAILRKIGGKGRHRSIPKGPVRFAEARLEADDQVYVLGAVQSRPMTAKKEAEFSGETVFMGVSLDGKQFSGPIGSYIADLLSIKDYFPSLGSDYRSIFVISSAIEEDLISSWRSKMWKQLLGGFAVFIIGLVTGLIILGSMTT